MIPETPRYLVPFHPKTVSHRFTDVLIIGGGLAGLRAAMEIDPKLRVLVVTKDKLQQSNSTYAQGGIAGVLDSSDRFEWHVQDTLNAGGSLCQRKIVEMVVEQAPQRIQELIEFGTQFDRDQDKLTLGREGGHRHNRVVHALGDATGREIMRAVIERIRHMEHIEVLEDTFSLDLLTDDEQRCRGIVAAQDQRRFCIWAKQTILCTGGCGQIYRESTNPLVATGDGHAMAFRAGVELRDMEFVQFHPTVLYIAGSSRTLITEAVRGEGAYLLDRDGHRFMPEYDPQAELAPRDVVSQSIVRQMEKTEHSHVYLDLSHMDAERTRKRFPGIAAACAEFGIDITRDRIPVRPGAHYMIGGVTVDAYGRTSMPHLWAAGEVTSSGLHGANRLASNSLLEGLVYGRQAGSGASSAALAVADEYRPFPVQCQAVGSSPGPIDLFDIRNSLKSLMGRAVGVSREMDKLEQAAESVAAWQSYVIPFQFETVEGWELQNMLTLASVIIAAALQRTESRGVHLRSDFPAIDEPAWKRHVCFQGRHSYLS